MREAGPESIGEPILPDRRALNHARRVRAAAVALDVADDRLRRLLEAVVLPGHGRSWSHPAE